MAVNYVKFYRGTPLAFENTIKNSDTLYFITETDSNKGSLYLGDKLISNNISSIADLDDITLSELSGNQILAYDEENDKWVNKSILDAVGVMIGATNTAQGSNGLVPAPGMGQQNLFLRGDGTWATPVSTIQLSSDNKTIKVLDGNILSLKDFGTQYYKYIEASGSIEEGNYIASHYELQIVDSSNPWKEGLEPKVVEENGELVLGWFEPNPTTLDGVVDELTSLQDQINDVSQNVQTNVNSIKNLSTEVKDLSDKINGKADITSVYTKNETDLKINEAIANVQHLKRKTFTTLNEAEEFAASVNDPENYIYMISSTENSITNKYVEYLYIDGNLEQVGSWEVDLDNYVTDAELAVALMGKVNVQEGHTLISEVEKEKLATIEAGAQKNFIVSVEDSEFIVSNEGKISLNKIEVSKITNLENILNDKADTSIVNALNTEVTNLKSSIIESLCSSK